MQMQTRGPGAGWSWLMGGFTVARHHPGKVLGAAALTMLGLGVPSAIQLLARPQGRAILMVFGVTALCSSVLYPLLIGGFMRLLHAAQNDGDVRVALLFDLFRPGRGGARMVLFGLCLLVVYVAFLALVLATVGHSVVPWYVDIVTRQASGVPLTRLPALPAGFGPTLALISVFFLFYSGTLAIGTGQVALRHESPLAALRDGAAGAFKNVLPLVVLTLCGCIALLVFVIAAGILIAILMLLGHFVSSVLGFALAGIVYILLLLAMVACMLGVNYAMWRDVTDATRDGNAAGAVEA